jgi:NADH-quinone oxidoreductase subunit J
VTGDLIFYLLAALAVIPAFWVVLSNNLVHSGFALLFTLLGVAGLYAWMGADFIAVTQLMVYVGGVLVLILFTVMMTRVPRANRPVRGLDRYVPAGFFSLATLGLLYKVITSANWATTGMAAAEPTTSEIGLMFMTNYIFPFEYVSLVLLSAMIGAALLIRERRPVDETPENKEEEVQS